MSLNYFTHQVSRAVFIALLIISFLLTSVTLTLAAPCDTKSVAFVRHDLSLSYCELCSYGYVTVVISNPYRYTAGDPFADPVIPDIPGATMSDLVLETNMGISGLTFEPSAPNPVTYQVNSGITLAGAAPTISGGGAILTFSQSQIAAFSSLASRSGNSQVNQITLRFAVRRSSAAESLVSADRQIQSTLSFDTDSFCSDSSQNDIDTLPLREPIPAVIKTGWNYDAGQRQNSATNVVYGNNNDDIVWRVRIDNNGLAGMQDLRFDDLMDSGSVTITQACASDASANTIAANNGVGSAPGCVGASNSIANFNVTNPFGNNGLSFYGHEVDVTAGGSASVYLVGKIAATGSCTTSQRNSVDDVQWGCDSQPPLGGILATSTGLIPAAEATFYSRYNDEHAPLTIERYLTGTNTDQPVGSNGLMTIIIRNNSAGSVKNIELVDLLPPEYVVDATFLPELVVTPYFGVDYPGIVDTLRWLNPQSDPLDNTSPEFELTSTTTHPIYTDQVNMLRQGDVAVVRFRVVLIKPEYYDRSANLDANPETYGGADPDTDPNNQTTLSNQLTVDFDLFCAGQGHQQFILSGNGSANPTGSDIPAFPEDLDIAVGGDVFILTNDPDQRLTLPIRLTNNGGHDAADYHTFVTFGATMDVVDVPSGCSLISLNGTTLQPDPWKVWIDPTRLPATATVYECTQPAVIAPGQTVSYNFDVIKTADPARIALDDLSLRADVVGEITLSDDSLLDFPNPLIPPRSDGEPDSVNNYSLDATWARVIGFNLKKTQVGVCTENNPPSYSRDDEDVQIGEECSYRIETGGWFGFDTPGFVYIAVQNIDVVDQVPDGQAYISNTDPLAPGESTPRIAGISLNPADLSAVDEGWFDWSFNIPDEQRIEVADEWFKVNTTTRLLNKALDQRLAPNLHAVGSYNVLTSTFDATFSNVNTGLVEQYTLGPNTVGYPIEAVRRVDLMVTEPLIRVVKEVCNESLYGTGTSCSNFVPRADDGDAYSSYLYRLTITNTERSAGVQHAPAYDVTVTDLLDASDLAYVIPFAGDGLDNDGDGILAGADADEGNISDNTVKNTLPAQLTFSYLHSSALERIDPGQAVTLYYRVDFDDDAAPLQTFTNRAEATYDSLAGDSGSQTVSPQPNSTLGGARFYRSDSAAAEVRVLPVETQPKTVERLANTPLLAVPGSQEIVVGEEVEYQLRTLLPVALLRDFVVRDELPAGLRCVEAPDVNLDAEPYLAAGFEPGGIITPTCNDNLVEWNFGNQRLTSGTGSDRFDFSINFIGQLINTAITNDAELIANGYPATEVVAEYLDETNALVRYVFDQVDVAVTEPLIELTQMFSAAVADAADTLTVTVSATNNGTAPAYNLRVLAPLDGTSLSYSGNITGSNPPDQVDVTLGANQPIFSWSVPNGIDVGATVSFAFDVVIADDVQPHQLLETTLQADWTSLPGQDAALNSSGFIDVNGSINGMRNGTIPNSGDPINDYETTATATLTIALPGVEKTDQSLALVPTIGVHKLFRIRLSLAEGVTSAVIVNDSLNAAGLSYVLADNAEFAISYSFSGIASINGDAPSEAAFNSLPSADSSGVISWDIGTVVTQTEDDSNAAALNPTIQIDYYARINNDLDTDAGDLLQNGVELNYFNVTTAAAEILTDASASVIVSEPDLSLTKTLANVTAGKQPGDAPVAGDTIEYQLILMNTGSSNSTAFDLNIVDTMPAGLVLDPAFTPTATIDSVAVAGFVAVPAGAPSGPLVWGRDNADSSLDLPAGQLLVITYQTEVQLIADPSGLIENGVWSDWTSLSEISSYERTGVGCPTIIAPNDYCVGPVYATTVGIAPELMFQKRVVNETSAADPGVNASPGDWLRYRLQVTSVTNAAAAYSLSDEIDRLNASPYFVPGSLAMVSVPAGANDSSNPSGGSSGTGLVTINNLTLDGLDSEAIELRLQLAPVIADGTVVLNQAELLLFGYGTILSDDPNVSGSDNPTQTLISSTPQWQFDKTVSDLTGASSVLFAGDRLRYRISVKNIGSENAIDVLLRDAIPANTTYVADSTTLNGVMVADPTVGVSALEAGLLINAPEDVNAGVMRADSDVEADNVAVITFEVVVDINTASGTLISNQAFLDGNGEGSGAFSDQPSDDPDSAAIADPTVLVVSSIDFSKSVDNLTQAGSGAMAEPGDTLRYRLTLTNNGIEDLSALTVVDELEALQAAEPTFFVPGSLVITAIPSGADSSATLISGGSKGTGMVAVSAINIAAGESVFVEFTVELAAVITSGTEVLNQAQLSADDVIFLLSDSDDAALVDEADPTVTLISSAPLFQVHKISTILDGDPAVLLADESLRYTIVINNIGNEDAVDVLLQDYTPSNTTYVPGSLTLNGSAVADLVAGVNPLHDGILVTVPDSSISGFLPADASAAGTNSATVTFDVVIAVDAMDGLIIENQGFVRGSGAGSGAQPEQPSDDPRTPTVDDPTRNIVGNLPLLYALKTVEIAVDNGSVNSVDPGDTLRYTIVVTNMGAIPATAVELIDTVPLNTLYVDGSTTLNGVVVADSPAGVLPLVAGLEINSSDNPGSGIVSAGQSAEVTFDVLVAAGVASGTILSNQGTVASDELADLLTDADGLPANGYQPTLIAVGAVQQLAITLAVAVADGGSAEPGAELVYTIRVTNIGALPATLVRVSDDLAAPLADQINYINGSATLNGLNSGVSFTGDLLSVDYSNLYGDLTAGASFVVRFNATIDPALAYGTTITNSADVYWSSPPQSATASVALDVGGTPDAATLNGSIWHDIDLDRVFSTPGENGQQDWIVELFLEDVQVAATTTDERGSYQLRGLVPSAFVSGLYELRFTAPGAGTNTAALGVTDSVFTNRLQAISAISVSAGAYLQNLNLPLWPNGTIYNSVARTAVGGATVSMLNASTGAALPVSCFDDPAQQGQVSADNGFYKFDLNFSQSACPPGGSYLLDVEAPAADYLATPSLIIPPTSDQSTAPFSVPTCPASANDAVPATSGYCEAIASPTAPPLALAAGSAGTEYYLHLTFANGSIPGQSQIFNNAIPIDPELDGAVAITKTAEITSVTKATQIPYTITVTNIFGAPLDDVQIVDRFPAGFKYVAGSALVDGSKQEPTLSGRTLSWDHLRLDVNDKIIIRLLLIVGSGVSEGEYVNRAQVYNMVLGTAVSGEASATVRVIPDPDFDCTDVIGKVFDDRNMNGYQDDGEAGLAGVRVATARGLIATTDPFGRYHITCAVVPDQDRGSNFIMKLDDRSLPSGYRVVTENPRVQRATRGKMLRFNFGATIHRVVTINIADAVFEPGTNTIRLQWRDKLNQLLDLLEQEPAVLRLSYLGDVEAEDLVETRLKMIKEQMNQRWKAEKRNYSLTTESEIFWRRGAPLK